MDNISRKEALKRITMVPLLPIIPFGSNQRTQGQPLHSKSVEFDMKLFPLDSIRLLPGPFKRARNVNYQYLLSLQPDRLLHWHRKSAGLQPKADHYGGWENEGSIILGHYLSACSKMLQCIDDSKLQKRVNYIVDELKTCQSSLGTGALFNNLKMQDNFEKLKKGILEFDQLNRPAFPVVNGQNPWYGIHKDFAGLRDAYWYSENKTAKEILIRFADWASDFADHLTVDQFQAMLEVEHGGMAEVIADVYDITGDKKYLRLAKRFVHQRIAKSLSKGQDILYPEHANTQIPKFVGYARMYEVDREDSGMERQSALNFWDIVIRNHTLVTGGNSEFERFGEAGKVSERIGYSSAETCNTYNMLKLSKHLFTQSADRKYIDYYERALYNHILAAIGPEEGMFCYYVSHKQGHFKTFSTPHDSNWCCVGTGIENPAVYGEVIYSYQGNDFYINLFIPSELDWKEKGFSIRQETKFPNENKTRFKIKHAGTEEITLKIRRPNWIDKQGMQVTVNGNRYAYKEIDKGYIGISKKWEKGDEIQVSLPMSLHLEATPDNQNIAAILYGPVVLVSDLGSTHAGEIAQRIEDHWGNEKKAMEHTSLPTLVRDPNNPSVWIESTDSASLAFILYPDRNKKQIPLKPLYQITDERYSIYWDIFSPKEWQKYQKKKSTFVTDVIHIGDKVAEEAHNLSGKNMVTGTTHFCSFRGAKKDGWFSYDMFAETPEPLFLVCRFWGGGHSPVPKGVFDILVDNTKIASHDLADERNMVNWVDTNHPMRFYETVHSIPNQLTADVNTITVRFHAWTDMSNTGLLSTKLVTAEGLTHKDLLSERSI